MRRREPKPDWDPCLQMSVPYSNYMNDSTSPDTTVLNTAAVWGTGPNEKSKDFCYSCHYTLFQITLNIIRDKGCTTSSTTSPLFRTYDPKHISGVQVSKLYPFTLIRAWGVSCSPGWVCQLNAVQRQLCGDMRVKEPNLWLSMQVSPRLCTTHSARCNSSNGSRSPFGAIKSN